MSTVATLPRPVFFAASLARFSFSITFAELSESPSESPAAPASLAGAVAPGSANCDIRFAGFARKEVGSVAPLLLPVTAVFTNLSIWYRSL
uniref:Uncharacterized protein n=1 Tax=Anopheles darlingi TaxID=43151 RepID=A0A2M4DM47_ANODA